MTTYTLETLIDREAIRDCLYMYCRGIDRLDEKALRAAYWPDATDSHGAYKGSASGFIDMALVKLQQAGRMVHQISNILIELHGNEAAVESYFTAYQEEKDAMDRLSKPCCAAAMWIDLKNAKANGVWLLERLSMTGKKSLRFRVP